METKAPLRGVPQGAKGAPAETGKGSLEELRKLLVGSEQKRLAQLERRLDELKVKAEEVSQVLPDAIRLHGESDSKLVEALSPSVREALRHSVEQDPKPLTEAVFPIMGPAIRRSISETLARLIQSFNQTLENSLSPQALKWRLEAFRTGKPFAEVVLCHTLAYRVEQVFLVHRESGLLLQHALAPAVAAQDASIVSGMLTAIQDFVRDSFRTGPTDDLHALEVGDLKVWVESGPKASLAAVIRGTPPLDLRESLQLSLERIHEGRAQSLREFSGDTAPFELCQPELQACLLEAQKSPAEGGKKKSLVGPLVAGTLGALVLLWLLLSYRSSARWNAFFEDLRSKPGVQVTAIERSGGKYVLRGLRDPLAVEPGEVLAQHQLPQEGLETRWEAYCSLSPQIVVARAANLLKPPPGVSLRIINGSVLEASGTAPRAWARRALDLGPSIPGVTEVSLAHLKETGGDEDLLSKARTLLRPPSGVELKVVDGVLQLSGSSSHAWIGDAERLVTLLDGSRGLDRRALIDLDEQRLSEMKAELERLRFFFQGETPELAPESRELLTPVVLRIEHLIRTAQTLGGKVSLTVVTTREEGVAEASPRNLERIRAETLARALTAAGVEGSVFDPPGPGQAVGGDGALDGSLGPQASLRVHVKF